MRVKAATIPATAYQNEGGLGYLDGKVYAVGCMTKSNASTSACNSTSDTSGFMRTVWQVPTGGSDPICDLVNTITWNGSICSVSYTKTCSDGTTGSGISSSAPSDVTLG